MSNRTQSDARAKRTMRVVLEVDVADLPNAERAQLAAEVDTVPEELPALKDTSATEAAEVLQHVQLISEELFAGSDLYVQFTDARVKSAKWIRT